MKLSLYPLYLRQLIVFVNKKGCKGNRCSRRSITHQQYISDLICKIQSSTTTEPVLLRHVKISIWGAGWLSKAHKASVHIWFLVISQHTNLNSQVILEEHVCWCVVQPCQAKVANDPRVKKKQQLVFTERKPRRKSKPWPCSKLIGVVQVPQLLFQLMQSVAG